MSIPATSAKRFSKTPSKGKGNEVSPPNAACRSDFFISYNKADRAWAEWIAWVLENVGYRCVIQAWDFVAGSNFVLEMHKADQACERTIAVLSPEYLESAFAQPEWAAKFAEDPKNENHKLLIARVAECVPTGLLKAIVYIDLVGKNQEQARKILLSEIKTAIAKAGRRKPTKAPPFPAGKSEKPAFPGSDDADLFRVPHGRNPNFTGRDNELAAIHKALTPGTTVAITQAIHGLGGVGKTQLALEYCYRHRSEYRVMWWLAAEETSTLVRDLAELGEALNLSLPPETPPNEIAEAVHAVLANVQPSLVVFDNAPNADAIAPFLPRSGHALITSRSPNWSVVTADDIAVPVMPKAKAVEFLQKRIKRKDADAGKLAEELGCLPLALEHAGAYIEASKCSVADYLDMFRRNHKELLKRATPPQGYTATIATTWAVSLKRLRKECPSAILLMNILAFFDPDAVPLSLITASKMAARKNPLGWAADSLKLNDAITTLREHALVVRERDRLSTHRLVQLVVRDEMLDREWLRCCRAAISLVNASFPFDSDDIRTWPRCEEVAPHARAVTNHADLLGVTSGELGRILNQLSLYFEAKALYGNAEPLMRRALAIAETSYGPDHPNVATCLNNLAQLLQATNRLKNAEPLMRRALAIDEKACGRDHPSVARDLNNLASLLRDTNRLKEAEPLMRRALAIAEKSYGPDHPEVATRLNNLALLLQSTNRLKDAEPLMCRALAIAEKSYGPDHPNVGIDLNNLASLLQATNRLKDAEPLMRRALAIDEKSYGADHPQVATRLNNLALLLYATKRLKDAEPLMRRALEIFHRFDKVTGHEHPHMQTTIKNYGALIEEMSLNPKEIERRLKLCLQ